jgi:ABC-2 type transport system ATP-binding protein
MTAPGEAPSVSFVTAAVEAHSLHKRYGKTVAVDDLSFSVSAGRVTGFVGPNGAGKSTTMRIVLGLDAPDAGVARIGGRRYRELPAPLCEVGAVLDAGATHPGRRARDHLRWLARSNSLPTRRVDEVLELVGLSDVARRRTGGFSLGMAQRLGIAAALLGDPPLLLLDEPVNGLDPDGIRWMRALLRSLADEGRAVFVSSHLMSELEGIADDLVVIGRGRLIAQTSVGELLASTLDGRVQVRTPQASEVMTLLAEAGATVTSTGPDSLTVSGLDVESIADLAAARKLLLHELYRERPSLEDAYFNLTRDSVEYATADGPEAGS